MLPLPLLSASLFQCCLLFIVLVSFGACKFISAMAVSKDLTLHSWIIHTAAFKASASVLFPFPQFCYPFLFLVLCVHLSTSVCRVKLSISKSEQKNIVSFTQEIIQDNVRLNVVLTMNRWGCILILEMRVSTLERRHCCKTLGL